MNPTHRLDDKDRDARTATCSVCGPVKILPAGRGWVCANKKRAQKAQWAAANPEKVAASRARPGAHRLMVSDGTLGQCLLCGEVPVVPWGRGYACKVRADQLRQKHQDSPALRCRDCKGWNTELSEGRCTACRLLHTPHRSLDLMPRTEPQWDHTVDLLIRRHLSEPRDDGRDRTNPGLKVIGSREVPEEWLWAVQPNPDWSRLDSM